MGIYVGPPAALHGQVCLLQLIVLSGTWGGGVLQFVCVSMCVSELGVLETTKHNRISQAKSI